MNNLARQLWNTAGKALGVLGVMAFLIPSATASVLSLGPHILQSLVAEQLFNRAGRWYLIDDGGICYTYLESPHTRIEADRLVLTAHLSSRLGQRAGSNCIGAEFSSDVSLSGKLRGADHRLILDDIRIDRVDDDSTRTALNLALQLSPQAIPRSASIDVFEFLRRQVVATGGSPVRLDEFHIVNITTHAAAVVIQFDLNLSAP
jgi:hypothetical protein